MRNRLAAAVMMFAPLMALAQAPQLLGYQGRLVKMDGTPESGNAQLRFGLFAAETGGTSLWEETQAVSVVQGYYSTYLGRVTTFPAALFDTGTLWLELAVQAPGDTQFRTMTPRQRVGSVAFALNARALKGGAVDATSVSVNGTAVIDATGRLTPASGAVTVNTSGCSNNQVLQWNGSAWQCASVSGTGGIASVSGTAPITVMNGTSAPVVSVAVGTTAGTVAAGNDSRFGNATTLQGTAVASTTPTNGQVLSFNGTQWTPTTPATGGTGVTSVTAGTGLTGGTITSTGTIGIATGGVGAAQLAAGAVTFDKLAPGGCSANQVLRFDGTAWGCATVGGGSSAPPLIANFEFEETGMTFNDSSGLGNNATFSSGLTAGAVGHTGTGANFSGGFASVAMGNTIPNVTQVQVEAWIWPQSVAMSGSGVLAAKTGAWSLRYLTGASVSDLDFAVTTQGMPATCTVATTGASIPTTGWTHVGGYYDGLNVAITVNGVVVASAACPRGALAANAGTTLTIGGTAAGNRYLGFLDELRVRSVAQIPTNHRYVYTEWGVATCSNGAATLMGDGLATKNHYTHSDSDPFCLSRTVATGPSVAPSTATGGGNLLYGMQLGGDRSVLPAAAASGNPKVRCALCAAPRQSCFQVAGITCPAGFVTQYAGYLYSNHYTSHGGSSPICLNTGAFDSSLGTAPDNQGYIYPVFQYGTPATAAQSQFVRCALCCTP
jgi:hypothetical protein